MIPKWRCELRGRGVSARGRYCIDIILIQHWSGWGCKYIPRSRPFCASQQDKVERIDS
jgi:hypothetical protein